MGRTDCAGAAHNAVSAGMRQGTERQTESPESTEQDSKGDGSGKGWSVRLARERNACPGVCLTWGRTQTARDARAGRAELDGPDMELQRPCSLMQHTLPFRGCHGMETHGPETERRVCVLQATWQYGPRGSYGVVPAVCVVCRTDWQQTEKSGF